ncbi:MAG: periplasmic component of the Tol biopolymer transport system, partial [Chthonomonadales bacterium]|nr:periplasmic component of the Tol biopolymer transport system [Chthonomonadales bacterium]
ANREWQLAQELACDDMAVLNTKIDVAEYGEMLVRMVTPSRHSRTPGIASLSIVESLQTLHRRLIAMRSIQPISHRKLAAAGSACVALGIFGIVPWHVVAQGARADRILFVSNRVDDHRFSIFAMDPDGSHVVRLTHGPLPESDVVSGPDGKGILRPAATHRNAMEIDPVWSPDGHRIAFALVVAEKPEPGSRVKTNLYVMNADGSGCKQVTFFDYGLEATAPAWSPDGKRIAFTLQNREEGAPGGVCSSVFVTDFSGFWPVADGMYPSWSKDGKQVLYSAYSDAKSRTELTPELYEAHSTGAYFGKKQLVHGVRQGALSPDGKRLAYISNRAEPNGDRTGNIFVSNADGSQPEPLTDLHDAGPIGLQWSSDGRRIYFTRPTSPNASGAPNYIIYGMDANGSHIQALTKGDAPDCLGASPDSLPANKWMSRIATMKEAK